MASFRKLALIDVVFKWTMQATNWQPGRGGGGGGGGEVGGGGGEGPITLGSFQRTNRISCHIQCVHIYIA